VHHLPSVARTRITGGRERGGGLERVGWLDPYTAETIAAEARRAGPGARLEVVLPASATPDGLAAVENMFAWLREKGVDLVVRRDDARD
jgi:hypothetical protein